MEYLLKNQSLTVKFKTIGGALSSIKDLDGVEYLWQGDQAYWGGQAPVLFPICGSLRDDRAEIGGDQSTHMPRHGIVRKKEFLCEQSSSDSVTFCIRSDEEMYRQYPFFFKLAIKYSIFGKRIRTEYIVENCGSETMPFFIGGHPGFRCPLFPDEQYEDYFIEFSQKESLSVPRPITETGLIDMGCRTALLNSQNRLNLDHRLFKEDAVILDELKSRSLKLVSSNHGKGVKLDFEDFPYLILWSSANQGPFVALEPWTGLSTCSDEGNVFEEKRNIQKVEAGKSRNYSFDITVL